jgi:hypothetical protein
MRRIVCLLVIVLICYVGMNIVKTVHQNNDIYDQIKQKNLVYEKNRDIKADEITSIINENKEKVEELESYEKWLKEIQENMD